MTRNDAFFVACDLSHSYGRGTPLEVPSLNGVSLEVARGEIVGIIGPTGSGKSTLLQHLCGLMRPESGDVWVDGFDLANPDMDPMEIRRRVGMVFQLPEDQLFERYVGDDVAFGPRNQGLDRATIRERVRVALESVGLPFDEFKDRVTLALSGGERRKVALAGVLAMAPEALLLDEPTAGLDPRGRAELLALLKKWHEERDLTIVLSSHNMDDLANLAYRVYVISEGRNVLSGTTREVFAQTSALLELGLGIPSMTAIVSALAAEGLPVRKDVLTLEEAVETINRLWR
jgi:energy-coupling factor transporter ATPase